MIGRRSGIGGAELDRQCLPNLGQSYVVDSFTVVVFGGVGNPWGAAPGAVERGVLNRFLEPGAGAVLGKTFALVLLLVGGAALISVLNLGTAPSSPLHVPSYAVGLAAKYLCFAIPALAIDLVWGLAGILSLGHAAFFALRGYPWACT